MKEIVIYTTRGCPYCVVAKRALDGHGIPYREIDITFTPEVRDELKARTGEWTVPQVFVDDTYIGQDDELVEMVESGQLQAPAPPAPEASEASETGAEWDVVVIGAGTSGLTAARRLAADGRQVMVLDRAPHVAGEDPAYDRLRDDVEAAGARCRKGEVFGLDPGEAGHGLITLDEVIRARAVVVATGLSDRTPVLPGEATLRGKGVSHCAACDAAFFSDLPVAVVGADERACEAALLLAERSRQVTLVCPAATLSAAGATQERLLATPNLHVRLGTEPTAIAGESHVTGLAVVNTAGETRLEVSGVFLYLPGDRPGTGFLHGVADIGPDGALAVSDEGETSRPGLFALGPAAAGGGDADSAAEPIARAVGRRLAPR